jgi:hypothetical protein
MLSTRTLVLLCFVILRFSLNAQIEKPYSAGLFFYNGEVQLNKKARETVDSLLFSLRQSTGYRLQLSGYGDGAKDSVANAGLAKNRVAQIRAYLLGAGVLPDMIIEMPYRPAEAPKEGYRATLKVWQSVAPLYYDRSESAIDTVTIPSGRRLRSAYRAGRRPLDSLFRAIQPPVQEFCFFPGRDTLLFGRSGTAIFLPGQAVKAPPACKNACVTIRLQEVLTRGDHLASDLSTVQDNAVFESGGAVYVEALCGNQSLPLQTGGSFQIWLPTDRLARPVFQASATAAEPGKSLQWARPRAADPKHKTAVAGPIGFSAKGLLARAKARLLLPVLEQHAQKIAQQPYPQSAWAAKAYLQRFRLEAHAWGWHRAGSPFTVDSSRHVTLELGLAYDEATDCKLLFPEHRLVVPAVISANNQLLFTDLPTGKATFVAMRFQHGQLFWDTQEVVLGTTRKLNVHWQPVSPETLRNLVFSR